MELIQAKKIAVEICYKLHPYCERINIAGSIRRKKPEVKDIELICIAEKVPFYDLFGNTETLVNNPGFNITVNGLGIIEKGKTDGKYMKIHLAEHAIDLDLFMPDSFDYFRQFAIRTGSAEFTTKYIAGGWKKIGWCGSDKGLRRISDCEEIKSPDGKSKWKCINPSPQLPPNWPDEESFWNWLGLKYLEPQLRNL